MGEDEKLAHSNLLLGSCHSSLSSCLIASPPLHSCVFMPGWVSWALSGLNSRDPQSRFRLERRMGGLASENHVRGPPRTAHTRCPLCLSSHFSTVTSYPSCMTWLKCSFMRLFLILSFQIGALCILLILQAQLSPNHFAPQQIDVYWK